MGVEAIEKAPFLSDAQRRGILHDNAMRFFGIDGTPPLRPSRVCGS
jgi:hypothetical protein